MYVFCMFMYVDCMYVNVLRYIRIFSKNVYTYRCVRRCSYIYIFTSIKLTVSSAFIQGWHLLFTFSEFVCVFFAQKPSQRLQDWWAIISGHTVHPGARWLKQWDTRPLIAVLHCQNSWLGRPQNFRYRVYINVPILIGTLPSTCTLQMVKS